RLLRQLPYVIGVGLDLIAGAFILIAVSRLPLFIVQAIIASGVVLTAFLEQLFLKRKLSPTVYLAAAVVLIGLGSLAAASHGEPTTTVSNTVKDVIIGAPVLLLGIGAVAMKVRNKLTTGALAGLSGTAF